METNNTVSGKRSREVYENQALNDTENNISVMYELTQARNQLDNIFNLIAKQSERLNMKEKDLQEKEQDIEEKQALLKDLVEREERISIIEKKLSSTTTIQTKLGRNQVVKLNIGGKIFATNLATLTNVKETFFTNYFNDHVSPSVEEDDRAFFIDRPNEQFHLILNYLRGIDIKQKVSNMNDDDLNDFIEEIVYYQLIPIYEILPNRGKKILESKHIRVEKIEFDKQHCSSAVKLLTPTKAQKTGNYGWNAIVLGTKADSFKIKLTAGCYDLLIGFSPRTKTVTFPVNYGYYLRTVNGMLHSPMLKKKYSKTINNGSIIECKLKEGEISYRVNDKELGIAYSNINDRQLYPAIILYNQHSEIELLSNITYIID